MTKSELIEKFKSIYAAASSHNPTPTETRYELGKLLYEGEQFGLYAKELSEIIEHPVRTLTRWKKFYTDSVGNDKKPVQDVPKAVKTAPTQPKTKTKTLEELVILSKTKPKPTAKYKNFKPTTIYLDPELKEKLLVLKSLTGNDISGMTNTALESYIKRIRKELNV